MVQSECKDCKDREVGCHGKCEKYKKFLEESAKDKEKYHKSLIWDKYYEAQVKKQKRKK